MPDAERDLVSGVIQLANLLNRRLGPIFERAKVTLVRAQEVQRFVAVGEHHDRRIRQSDPKIGVPLHDSLGMAHILRREEIELVRPARDLLDKSHLRLMADSICNQVVQFRENKGRDNARRCRGDKCRDCAAVQRFVGVERGVEPASVQDDHRTPKPSSARSTSSASDGPVERKSGSLGTAASASTVSRATASRSNSASLHRRCAATLFKARLS